MSHGEAPPRMSSYDRTMARLGPHAHRARPVFGGIVLQIAGVTVAVAYLVAKSHHEDASGTLTLTTLRLAWHDTLRSATGITALAISAVLLLYGSTLLAKAFVRTRRQMLWAVPLAAILGVLVLGAIALAVAFLLSGSDGDSSDDSSGGPGRTRGRRRRPGQN